MNVKCVYCTRQFKFIFELPPGYDYRTRIALLPNEDILVAHPDHQPLVVKATKKGYEAEAILPSAPAQTEQK